MSGDLSLSRALGGLRIANPDDAPPTNSPNTPVASKQYDHEPTAEDTPTLSSTQNNLLALPDNRGRQDDAQNRSRDPPSAIPPLHAASHAQGQRASYHADVARSYEQSAADYRYQQPTSSDLHSIPVPSRVTGDPIFISPELQSELSGAPSDGLSRVDSTADSHISHQSVPAGLSREPSQSSSSYNATRHTPLPPGGGPLPPRRSSRGMGGGYMSGVQPSLSQRSQGTDPSNPPSSRDWHDRGAAVGIRREVDANGQTVIRHVKKGVRDFSFGRVLGEGSYSTVYMATDRQTLKEYAIKVLEKKHIIKEKKIKYVNIEKNTLNRLTEHPGIVRLYYTFQDENCLYYTIDYCSGGELLGALKRTGTFDVECTRFYGAQILDAIEYMHSRGVIHRDLKPENVLLDDHMHIKITDFGTAKMLADPRVNNTQETTYRGIPMAGQNAKEDDGRAPSFVGTAEYVSPELLTNKNSCKASDLWAFGCIIYQLLAGRPPFKGGSEYLTFQKIVALDYEFPQGFPPAARDLVERLLVLDPARRLTIEHIKNHEFFDGQPFGKTLWRTKAPRLRPYVPPAQEPHIIQLNGSSSTPKPIPGSRAQPPSHPSPHPATAPKTTNGAARPSHAIAELPPPSQLDFEWSSVLNRSNERILKLGDLMVISAPLPNNPHGKGGDDGHKKLSRFFGGSTTKKRQRLVMITSSGRIILAPAGGDEKRMKQEISLLGADCSWRSQIDAKGQPVWCVDTGGVHYTFEEPKSTSAAGFPATPASVDEWIDSLERAKGLAMSQNIAGASGGDSDFGDMSSRSSPTSTLGGRNNYAEGFGISDKSGRNPDDPPPSRRNRFSKRQSKSGLGAAF